MKKQETNVEVVEMVETTEEVVVKESKLKNFGAKTLAFGKKHGKKLLLGAAAIGGGILLVSKLRKNSDEDYDYEGDDVEYDDDELAELVEMETSEE